MGKLSWNHDSNSVRLNANIAFPDGYDYMGLDLMRQEAHTLNCSFIIWPRGGRWSLYRDSDGLLLFESFGSEEECKMKAEALNEESENMRKKKG